MMPDQLADHLSELHEESFGWAMSCCHHDRHAAEDVLQTAYLRVISGKARFGGRSTFRTWLFGVIRLVAREHVRRQRSRKESSTGLVEVEEMAQTSHVGADKIVESTESSERLLRALEQLPERQSEALHLVFYGEMTIAEAAKIMGVSLGSARTHYERGKKRMRALLTEDGG